MNSLPLDWLDLNTDVSLLSQGVLSSDGIWRVKSIANGKGETSTRHLGMGNSAEPEPEEMSLSFALQVPRRSPRLQHPNHLSPQRAASESGLISSVSTSTPGASV